MNGRPSVRPAEHRKCGDTTEPRTVTFPSFLLPRIEARCADLSTSRSAYIVRLIERDLEQAEAGK